MDSQSYYAQCMERVKATPPPLGQKYLPGCRVKIDDVLPEYMSHFESGKEATVHHTYAHDYGGDDIYSYCLDVDGFGLSAWYEESQLAEVK